MHVWPSMLYFLSKAEAQMDILRDAILKCYICMDFWKSDSTFNTFSVAPLEPLEFLYGLLRVSLQILKTLSEKTLSVIRWKLSKIVITNIISSYKYVSKLCHYCLLDLCKYAVLPTIWTLFASYLIEATFLISAL